VNRTRPLFDPIPVASRTLSAAYGGREYRLEAGRVARFVTYGGRGTCDECAARQHETRGATPEGGGLRAPAKHRRIVGELALLLCHEHAELWRTRDAADLAKTLRATPRNTTRNTRGAR
jgi:hypothetical protein